MKQFSWLAVFALAGCLAGEEEVTEMQGSKTCDPATFQFLIGKQKESLPAYLLPDELRVLPPNSVMTMDHNPERLNVHIDNGGTITKVTCG